MAVTQQQFEEYQFAYELWQEVSKEYDRLIRQIHLGDKSAFLQVIKMTPRMQNLLNEWMEKSKPFVNGQP